MGAKPSFVFFSLRSEVTSCSVSQKLDTDMGQAPTFQARPRDTDHRRPSNLAASALRSVEHAPSKFGHDSFPVRRGLVAAVKYCCVRKALFFLLSGQAVEQNKRSQNVVWVSTPQRRKPVLLSVFRSHNCRLMARFLDGCPALQL